MSNLSTDTTAASTLPLNHRGSMPFVAIRGPERSDYESRVVQAYQDDPQNWSKAIGNRLWFQFGVYDHFQSPGPIDLDESGLRYFERQLEIAGLEMPDDKPVNRILDIGCGWGTVLRDLAERFPDCHRLDGINISDRQLEYCAEMNAARGLSGRIKLFRCNALDIDLLPDIERPYDLAIMRGVISHFPYDLFEMVMAKLRQRLTPTGTVIISDNLYNVDLSEYRSDTPDMVDRLACKYRKTPAYLRQVFEQSGFSVKDMRILPDRTDATRWLLSVQDNIERHFPTGAVGALEELRVMCESLAVAIVKHQVSIYSFVLERDR
ncbi:MULTISPECIES: SAM-dependent methyltransferase [Burkholderia]|uniref:SAM-dependent methyltransferase n=1 Tax=Burkholderia TaxID=32008 RepID=UPI000752C5B6|nr:MULTISPECIES: class I SAM-dependent methyltransferase [Burkholderia]KUY74361.1 methyltransferase type 12 [Burkholderia cepacia]KVL15712.1 methyltransferase type 12 [Burkholderia cepacia]KVQ33940.1 methyltransferase type 12 [Burkholderia cepacia]KVZ22588.1 methyltransferase type 12 [Burkholderia cepacia]CAG9246712.1 Methyltransferase type 12 [Burkholderia cepacia]